MPVAETSREVYRKNMSNGTIPRQTATVLSEIQKIQPCTTKQVYRSLKQQFPEIEYGTVSGRVSELKKKALVLIVGVERNENGNNAFQLACRDEVANDKMLHFARYCARQFESGRMSKKAVDNAIAVNGQVFRDELVEHIKRVRRGQA